MDGQARARQGGNGLKYALSPVALCVGASMSHFIEGACLSRSSLVFAANDNGTGFFAFLPSRQFVGKSADTTAISVDVVKYGLHNLARSLKALLIGIVIHPFTCCVSFVLFFVVRAAFSIKQKTGPPALRLFTCGETFRFICLIAPRRRLFRAVINTSMKGSTYVNRS